MSEAHGAGVPPSMPPPYLPPPNVAPAPPPVGMPPPVPGTGAIRQQVPPAFPGAQNLGAGLYRPAEKALGVAYILWFFLGLFGGHQFYLGKTGRAVGYFFTFAWCTVGLWIDLFTLPSQLATVNARRRAGVR